MKIVGRLRTPEIDIGSYNICEEVFVWIDFLVKNLMEKEHFLTTIRGRTYINSNNTSLDELLEMLPDPRRNTEEIVRPSEAKVIDSAYAYATSKVRSIMSCDVCYVPR